MLVTCLLSFVINSSGLPWAVKAQVEGKVLKSNSENYLIDFTQGLKKYPLTVKPETYNKVLIKKSECI